MKDWALKLDLSTVQPNRREHAKCYRGMIISHIDEINQMSSRMEVFYKDIEDYLVQLDKIKLYMPGREPTHPEITKNEVQVGVPSEKKQSPLLP